MTTFFGENEDMEFERQWDIKDKPQVLLAEENWQAENGLTEHGSTPGDADKGDKETLRSPFTTY